MINVTQTFLPDIEEYIKVLRRAWDKKWITNNGDKGDKGEPGVKGDTGARGEAGIAGINGRNGGGLDRCGLRVTGFCDGLENFGVEAECLKGHR